MEDVSAQQMAKNQMTGYQQPVNIRRMLQNTPLTPFLPILHSSKLLLITGNHTSHLLPNKWNRTAEYHHIAHTAH